jgi:hypothetical protein
VLRLAASGIAGMAGFSVDQIDDIKIAVSEVLLALIEHGGGQSIGHTAVTSFDAEHTDLLLCRTVLAGVCTAHGIELVDHQAHIWAAVAYASIT